MNCATGKHAIWGVIATGKDFPPASGRREMRLRIRLSLGTAMAALAIVGSSGPGGRNAEAGICTPDDAPNIVCSGAATLPLEASSEKTVW